MAVKRVGIIGYYRDADVQALKANIEDRGGEARIIDFGLYPGTVKGSITEDSLIYDDADLFELGAFYVRRLTSIWGLPVRARTKEEWADAYERFNDLMDDDRAAHSFRISVARALCERRTVVNPYEAWGLHHLKMYQFFLLKENGFNVPPFVAGNDYFALKSFLEKYDAVEKPIVTGPVRRVDMATLEKTRPHLRRRPTIYQQFIDGKSIRAFVLGDSVITACLLPHKEWGVDASERIEYMQPINLPAEVAAEVVRAAKTLGMIFSGVDLLQREADGKYFLLECNVAPYFRPYDAQVGANIGGQLADFLLERA